MTNYEKAEGYLEKVDKKDTNERLKIYDELLARYKKIGLRELTSEEIIEFFDEIEK